MWYLYLSLLLAALLSNSYVIYKLRKQLKNSFTVFAFVLFLICINVWAAGQILVNALFINEETFRHFDLIASIGWVNIPWTFLVFTLLFTHKNRFLKKIPIFLSIVLPALVFQYLAFTTNLLNISEFSHATKHSWGYETPLGPLFPIFLIWFEALFILSFAIFYSHYKSTTDITKHKQIQHICIAILIPLLIGSITDGVLPLLGYTPMTLAIPFTTIMAAIIGYTIIKYELFNIESTLVLSSIGEGIITTDKHLRINSMNNIAEKIIGISGKDILYRNLNDLIKLQDEENNILPVEELPSTRAISHNLTTEGVYSFIDNHSNKIVLYVTASPITMGKEVVGSTLIFNDITKHSAHDVRKDDFISIAAHEIASPVASLKAAIYFLEEMVKKKDDAELTNYVNEMAKKVDSLTGLIARVLDFSRLKSGTFVLQKEWTDINQCLDEVVANFSQQHPETSLSLEGKAQQTVYIDKIRITEVISNILTNALKYSTTENHIPIKVLVHQHSDELIIGVQDFGIGIAEKDIDKMFHIYNRLDTQTNKMVKGLGIGLYLANEIIKAHGGKMWVTSELGKGSIFYFSLPLHIKK